MVSEKAGGYIYTIGATGISSITIGKTTVPVEKRLQAIQTAQHTDTPTPRRRPAPGAP